MTLDLTSFRLAHASLSAVLAKSEEAVFMATLDETTRHAIRAGVIQHFEFTYELAWKFMKRWLESNLGRTNVDGVTRRELFRLAAEHRLIEDVDAWMAHHHARNEMSHTYDERTADEVYASTPAFVRDAGSLLAVLEARND